MIKKVVLSFDYELFFGLRSGTVDESLIKPTNKLLDAMDKEGFRASFFIDYLMLKYLKAENTERTISDAHIIENQLKDMLRRGHRIELHLHPHWIDSKYNGDGTWNYDNFSHYSLYSLDIEAIVQMFEEGTCYLNNLARSVIPDYKVCAFRAGGWAVQPFDILRKAFKKTGICIDSSTAYGVYNTLPDSYYDFRNMPEKSYYRFEDDVCVENEEGSFIEVPITTYHRNRWCSLIHKFSQYIHKGYNDRLTDGTHQRNDLPPVLPGNKLKNFLNPQRATMMMSFSQSNPYTIKYVMDHTSYELYCFIDHPKDFSLATCDGIHKIGQGYSKSMTYYDIKNEIFKERKYGQK